MTIILSPKCGNDKVTLKGVETSWSEDRVFVFVFKNGDVCKYPMEHIYYIQFST